MLIIPAIDLRGGRCVRLTQGRRDSVKVYDADPTEIAKGFEADGAQMLHLVDLDGAFSDPNSINRRTVGEIVRATQIPIEFGGGIRDLDQVRLLIELGVARVVLGTLAVESPEKLPELLRIYGSEQIAVAIDTRGGKVLTRGWEKEGALSAIGFSRELAALGVARLIVTDVSRDGMLEGVNVAATCEIARASGLRVTASGGVASLEDIERVRRAGCGIDSIIIGKALYEGLFTIQEALSAATETLP